MGETKFVREELTDADVITAPTDEQIEKFWSSIYEAVDKMYRLFVECVNKMVDACPNRRVAYLARHGSPRTRKKNIARIFKSYKKSLKKGSGREKTL